MRRVTNYYLQQKLDGTNDWFLVDVPEGVARTKDAIIAWAARNLKPEAKVRLVTETVDIASVAETSGMLAKAREVRP